MTHAPEQEPNKRKREDDDHGNQPGPPIPQPPMPIGIHPGPVNYVPASGPDRLGLLQGDVNTFSEIIGLIGSYEAILERHESLAVNLGAKLTGPRLLRGIDKFFEGPIRVHSGQSFAQPITWIDICRFAKTNPEEFKLVSLPDGSRTCQFAWSGLRVEISEDDWRFISSGALHRMPLEHPLEEDETAELATLDILEQRASMLFKKADEVAARARILNHKMGMRKAEILRRREAHEAATGTKFQSVNRPPQTANSGVAFDIHADLLQQFAAAAAAAAVTSRPASRLSLSSLASQRSPPPIASQPSRMSAPSRSSMGASSEADAQADVFRPLITQKIDKLARGDAIDPPCDRCRRLKLACVKHLTACQGCTKKHARCSWKALNEEEVGRLKRELGVPGDVELDVDAERGITSPKSSHANVRRTSEMVLAPIAGSAEGSRPASRGAGDPSAHSPYSIQTLLSAAGNRIDLPPVRMRTNLPQGHGPKESPTSTPTATKYPQGGSFGWVHSHHPPQ